MKRNMMVLMLVATIAACASMRGVEIGTDKSPTASTVSVSIDNKRSGSVQVFYDNGSNEQSLGSVSGQTTRSFSVPGGSTIVVRQSGGTLIMRQALAGTSNQTVVVR